jgi:hypothetical protein
LLRAAGAARTHGQVKRLLDLVRGRTLRFTRQEAFAAKDRTALGGFERYRGFPPALRAGGHGLALLETTARTLTFGFAVLTTLGFVLEILIVEKVLFTCGENEIRSAIYTFEDAILKLRHGLYPRQPEHVVGSVTAGLRSPAVELITRLPGVISSGSVCEPALAWP